MVVDLPWGSTLTKLKPSHYLGLAMFRLLPSLAVIMVRVHHQKLRVEFSCYYFLSEFSRFILTMSLIYSNCLPFITLQLLLQQTPQLQPLILLLQFPQVLTNTTHPLFFLFHGVHYSIVGIYVNLFFPGEHRWQWRIQNSTIN